MDEGVKAGAGAGTVGLGVETCGGGAATGAAGGRVGLDPPMLREIVGGGTTTSGGGGLSTGAGGGGACTGAKRLPGTNSKAFELSLLMIAKKKLFNVIRRGYFLEGQHHTPFFYRRWTRKLIVIVQVRVKSTSQVRHRFLLRSGLEMIDSVPSTMTSYNAYSTEF